MKKVATAMFFFLLFSSFTTAAIAHEFILKPVLFQVPAGHKLPFSVISAHVFMVSEEMEPIDKVSVSLRTAEGETIVPLSENEALMTLDGQVVPPVKGTAILAGHRQGMIWSKTTRGWKQAGKKSLTGVISSGLYEKFAKTLITVGEPDDRFNKAIGQKLEIIPLTEPANVRVGSDMEFQIRYEGNPLSTDVFASYDGFTRTPNTYAYFTETYGEGTAKVKITQPGTWMVRVQHTADRPTDDYDKHVMRATLVFRVDG